MNCILSTSSSGCEIAAAFDAIKGQSWLVIEFGLNIILVLWLEQKEDCLTLECIGYHSWLKHSKNSLHNLRIYPLVHLSIEGMYCHVSGLTWLITTGSGLDDWIYWHFYYNYNQLIQLTMDDTLRFAPFPTGLRASSLLSDCRGSHLRVGHFFSFRCPLVSTPQLNTQLLNSQFSRKRIRMFIFPVKRFFYLCLWNRYMDGLQFHT
jgi:hypothetical protein